MINADLRTPGDRNSLSITGHYSRAERVAAIAISAIVMVIGIFVPGGTWGLPSPF